MKANLLVLTVLSACSVLAVGCSSDDKVNSSEPTENPARMENLWSDQAQVEAWKSFNAGTQTAQEACSVYKGYDEETKVEYTKLGSLVWIDGTDYKTCDWGPDLKSACDVTGQFNDGVLKSSSDEGLETTITFKTSEEGVMTVDSLYDGEKTFKASELVAHEDTDFPPMVKITEEDASEMYKFMKFACGVNVGPASSVAQIDENGNPVNLPDPKLDR